MYLSIPSSTFKEILAIAKLAMTTKPTLPALGTLHCEVTPDGSSLIVTTTDLDITLVQTIPLAEQGGPGIACLNYKALAAVRADRNTPVRIQTLPFDEGEDNDAKLFYVSSGHSATAIIESADPSRFPLATTPPPEDFTCLLPGRTLEAINSGIPFISSDGTRPVLNGTLLSPDEGGSVVATDGRRLIQIRTKATPVRCIFPLKLCQAIARIQPNSAACAITGAEPGDWSGPHGTAISLRMGNITIHSNLIEGNFPNYKQVIPADSTSAITFSDPTAVASWLMALPELERSHSVTLAPRAPHFVDLIHARGRLTATAYLQGEPPVIAFNPRFLATTLSSICCPPANGTLHFTDEAAPGLVRGGTALAVIMPMRVTANVPPPAVNPDKPLETTAAA